MAAESQNRMPFKPYARLINILGDQLITDKIVAVMEILKNSYDADSPSAKVHFKNILNWKPGDLPLGEEDPPCIEIRDCGCGMTLQDVKDNWLHIATPAKLDKKKQEELKTSRGRIIQGEKGIGRFAIHKLGEKFELYTKAKGQEEVKLEVDFSDYDPDSEQNTSYKLLEEVQNVLEEGKTKEIPGESGTVIKIYKLREYWTNKDFESLYKNIQRLMPPVDKNAATLGIDFERDFEVSMYRDNKLFTAEKAATFDDVIERAQYTMIGSVDEKGVIDFEYRSNTPQRVIKRRFNLLDKGEVSKNGYDNLVGIELFTRRRDIHTTPQDKNPLFPQCGPFKFTFYAFDLKNQDKKVLTQDLKEFIKDNFVYVLRDGVRVYPYGEKGIDWLNLDKLRSTYRAGQFISYNDLTGFVYISQEGNPNLKDASSRQDIVNIDGAYDDFTDLVTAASEVFNTETKIDKLTVDIQRKKGLKDINKALIASFNVLKKALEEKRDRRTLEVANKFFDTYEKHTQVWEDRVKTVEDLAGLGIAVEKSSHDSLRLLSLMMANIKNTIKKLSKNGCDRDELLQVLKELYEGLALVYDDMQIIMPLFKINRKGIKKVSVLECIKKVARYFRYELNGKIETNVDGIESDLIVKTNTGLILQLIMNLVDNAVYWLNESNRADKKLNFYINSDERTLIVSDNGNGVREDIESMIFEEFVTTKSNGRGLGLYIVRELLLRINAKIYVARSSKEKMLPGANFVIKFDNEEIR